MKKGILILLLGVAAFASQLYGYESNSRNPRNPSNSTNPTNPNNLSKIDNPPNYTFADLLVWKLREGGAENWAQIITPAGRNRTAEYFGVPFKWKGGLRVGVGSHLDYDCWSTLFTYTYYQSTGLQSLSVGNGGIFSPFVGNFFFNNTDGANFGPNYFNANIKWKFLFNVFDLELGKPVLIEESIRLRPYIGIKSGFINQKIYTNWNNPTNAVNFSAATENLKNDFWGIGPSIGLDTSWSLYQSSCNSVNFIANAAGAIFFGRWSFSDVYQNNSPATITVFTNKVYGAATMARGFLGLEWCTAFYGSDLKLRLGYEAQIWFDQIQFYSLNIGRLDNLLSLQGGVIGIGFNF